MRTPSRVPRILLSIFVIITGAILAGLFTFVSAESGLRDEIPDEELRNLAYISFALGALAGGGVGALWSLLMNRLPPATSADRIILCGIGLGALAGPIAVLLGQLGLAITLQQWEAFFNAILVYILLYGVPSGLATGLVCSLPAWGISAWERRWLPVRYKPQIEKAYIPNRARLPRIFLAIFVILGSAVTYGYFGYVSSRLDPGLACLMGGLVGTVTGGLAATLWLFVMAQLPHDANCVRTFVTGGTLGAGVGVLINLIVFLGVGIAVDTERALGGLGLLFHLIVGSGALAGSIVGSVFGILFWASGVLEQDYVAKEQARRYFAQRGLNNLGSQPNP